MLHAISISFACIGATESDTNNAITVHKSTMLARNTRLVFIRPTKKISLQNYNWKLGVYRCDVWSVKSATNSDNKHLLYIYVLLYIIYRCRVHDFPSVTCKCIELEINRECFVEYIKVHMQRKKYESGILQLNHGSLSFLRTSHIMNEERIQNKNQKIRWPNLWPRQYTGPNEWSLSISTDLPFAL